MQELVQDEWAMSQIAKADFFQLGIPCSGASVAGRASRGLKLPEHHPEVGHLVASALMLINRINPAVVVVECVTQYAATASAQILRQQLRDSGYDVHEVDLRGREFGCLEHRDRWFLVAATKGLPMDLANLAPAVHAVPTVAEILDPIPADAPDWRTFDYLKQKEVRDAAKGSSFSMQVVTPASTKVGVLRRCYAKSGSTDPLLAHPTDGDLLRPFTVAEHARIKQVPLALVEGLGKTDGHILLGQQCNPRRIPQSNEDLRRAEQKARRQRAQRRQLGSDLLGRPTPALLVRVSTRRIDHPACHCPVAHTQPITPPVGLVLLGKPAGLLDRRRQHHLVKEFPVKRPEFLRFKPLCQAEEGGRRTVAPSAPGSR
jgi:site-specific DNA-cytosine methylase